MGSFLASGFLDEDIFVDCEPMTFLVFFFAQLNQISLPVGVTCPFPLLSPTHYHDFDVHSTGFIFPSQLKY